MSELLDFLKARLNEEEQAAASATSGPWRHDPGKHWRKPGTSWFEEAVFAGPPGSEATCIAGTGATDDPQSMADARYIAAHDPARVLREIGRIDPHVEDGRGAISRKDKTGVLAVIDQIDPTDPVYMYVLREMVRLDAYVEEITADMAERVVLKAREQMERRAELTRHRATLANPPTSASPDGTLSTKSVVYYARISDQIKIGTSASLEKRMLDLGIEEVMATEPGDYRVEQARHAQFSPLRLRGEWFRYEHPLIEWIARLRGDLQ